MGYYDFLDKLIDEDALNFKKSIRKLLDSTFIIAEKDPILYDYLCYSSNLVNVSNYLKVMGYDIVVDDKFKYAMLIQNESDLEIPGFKKINHQKFTNNQILTLFVLWLLFLERFGKSEETYIEFGEIIDMQKQYSITMSPKELKDALDLFKKYSLINYSEKEFKADTIITLYPTLQFALNKEQFVNVIKEMKNELKELEEEEDE